MSDFENAEFEEKSKSLLKREMTALQKLGEELVDLTASQLSRFELPENLFNAIVAARSMHQRGARKRQLQFIGKLMRHVDEAPISLILATIKNPGKQAATELHRLEQWRERLLTEGDVALAELASQYPDVDRQHLRQLVRKAGTEKAAGQPPQAARLIFAYLREMIVRGGEAE